MKPCVVCSQVTLNRYHFVHEKGVTWHACSDLHAVVVMMRDVRKRIGRDG